MGVRLLSRFMNIVSRSRFSPVTLETWKMGHSLSETNLVAERTTSSLDLTMTGYFRHPGDLSIRTRSLRVSCRTLPGHMSILVTTTKTGTLRASARPWRDKL